MVGSIVGVFGVGSGESSSTFSPVCPAALSHGALVSQVWAGCAASSRRLAPNLQPAWSRNFNAVCVGCYRSCVRFAVFLPSRPTKQKGNPAIKLTGCPVVELRQPRSRFCRLRGQGRVSVLSTYAARFKRQICCMLQHDYITPCQVCLFSALDVCLRISQPRPNRQAVICDLSARQSQTYGL